MSADLFAAFGQPNSSSGPVSVSQSTLNDNSSKGKNRQADGLGILHNPSLETEPGSAHQQTASGFGDDEFSAFEEPTRNPGNEVLFDASNADTWGADDEHEWGEFETAEPSDPKPAGGLLIDGLDMIPGSHVRHSPAGNDLETKQHATSSPVDLLAEDVVPRSTSHTKETNYGRGNRGKKTGKPSGLDTPELYSYLPRGGEEEDEEEWDDFESSSIPVTPKMQSNPTSFTVASHNPPRFPLSTDRTSSISTARQSAPTSASAQIRPSNIPPPIILLSLFPSLLDELQQEGTKYNSQLRSTGAPQYSKLPLVISNVARAMARVLLGRSFRWKRDQILAQSTKIGPARSGRSGGMKLSSVNKSEAVKEDKEAVELQEAWKIRAVFLNSMVAAANHKPVPPMLANLQVKTATADEGALKATHACALCGLRREERITRVDHDVNDSFDEWWTEHWGHSECKLFWEAHSSRLSQRR